jgi:membrane-associated phospholipid phosphatase
VEKKKRGGGEENKITGIYISNKFRINLHTIHAWQLTLFIIIAILLSLSLFAICIIVIVFLLRDRVRKYKPADMGIFERLNKWVSPTLSKWMLAITFLGKHQFLIPANLLLIFYFLFIERQNWFSIRVAAISLSSLALMFLLKYLFRRKRPLSPLLKAARGLSFPSGHAIMSVAFFGMLIYIVAHTAMNSILQSTIIALLVVLILLIGFSRVYLRVHYASDVLAGFIIGLIWLFISLAVLDQIEHMFLAVNAEDAANAARNLQEITHETTNLERNMAGDSRYGQSIWRV